MCSKPGARFIVLWDEGWGTEECPKVGLGCAQPAQQGWKHAVEEETGVKGSEARAGPGRRRRIKTAGRVDEGEWHSMEVSPPWQRMWWSWWCKEPCGSGNHMSSLPQQWQARGLPMGTPAGRVPALPELRLHGRDWPQALWSQNGDQGDAASWLSADQTYGPEAFWEAPFWLLGTTNGLLFLFHRWGSWGFERE